MAGNIARCIAFSESLTIAAFVTSGSSPDGHVGGPLSTTFSLPKPVCGRSGFEGFSRRRMAQAQVSEKPRAAGRPVRTNTQTPCYGTGLIRFATASVSGPSKRRHTTRRMIRTGRRQNLVDSHQLVDYLAFIFAADCGKIYLAVCFQRVQPGIQRCVSRLADTRFTPRELDERRCDPTTGCDIRAVAGADEPASAPLSLALRNQGKITSRFTNPHPTLSPKGRGNKVKLFFPDS